MDDAKDLLIGMLSFVLALAFIPIALFVMVITMAAPFIAVGAGVALAFDVFSWIAG